MEREIGISLGEMDKDAEQLARGYLQSMGKMTNGVESACKEQKGFFSSLWDDLRNGWESFWNWLGGKGWNSNTQLQINQINSDPSLSEEEKRNRLAALSGVPSYDVGTNYVPNDQLAMVHQGEAIIPAKYNKPYNANDNSSLYNTISAMNQEIGNLRSLIQQGIPVKGEFKQRGSDLVAVVEKGKNKNGNQPLSNPAYAR